MTDDLARRIRAHVDELCSHPHRDLGSEGNAAACAYAARVLGEAGARVTAIPFDAPAWEYGVASIRVADSELAAHPGPYSPAAEVAGPLVVATSLTEVQAIDAPGCVLLIHGALAAEQLVPRGYPFYSVAEQLAILEAIEAAAPAALIAATGQNPGSTGAMEPFPLVQDPSFSLPSCFIHIDDALALFDQVGEVVHVSINSRVRTAACEQVVGEFGPSSARRIVVSGHIDSVSTTPGALDNAGGCAVALAVAELLANSPDCPPVDIVPFNGEDNATAAGELAYLARVPVSATALCINIDAAGLAGALDAVSTYNLTEPQRAKVESLLRANASLVEGPAWPASDHGIYAFQGIPAVAITTTDFDLATSRYTHVPDDVPGILDEHQLAATARFVADLVIALAD